MEPITGQHMRDIERRALDTGAVTGLQLMERAGQGVVDAVFEEWPEFESGSHRAVVLCGPGNNGGDGFVVARLLHDLGWEVAAFFFGTVKKLPADARANYDSYARIGEIHPLGFPQVHEAGYDTFWHVATHSRDSERTPDTGAYPPFLMVDALFGIGLTRELAGLGEIPAHSDYLANFRDLNNTRLLAIDVPSGLDTDTGAPLWSEGSVFPALPADLTVTFHQCKPCHRATAYCGKVVIKDIGL